MSVGVIIGLLLAMSIPAAAGGTKVDVCHIEGNGDFHLININENAYQTHVDHGDASPGEPVPGMPGMKFGDDCIPQDIQPVLVTEGSFSNPYSGKVLTTGFSVYEEWESTYSGTGSYSYGSNSFSLDITDACIDEAGGEVTVRGTADANYTADGYAFLSIRDNGDGTFSTRAGIKANEAEIDGYYDTQCGSSPSYPASGSTGYLNFP